MLQVKSRRNDLLNFLPLAMMVVLIVLSEFIRIEWFRGLEGLTLLMFYWISIRMVFKKNLSKLLIALIIFPVTAFFVYIIMLFLAPRPKPGDTSADNEGSVEKSQTYSADSG